MDHRKFLEMAVDLSSASAEKWWFPAGALIVRGDIIISEWISIWSILNDPTAHAETVAIRKACEKLKTSDLSWCTLYSSMQPCVMCYSAAVWAKISQIMFICEKTPDMVSKWYYEWTTNIFALNRENGNKIVISQNSEYREWAMLAVKKWEAVNNILTTWA